MKDLEEIILKGISISKGIAIGDAFQLMVLEEQIPELPISTKEIESEIFRYRKALESSKCELEELQKMHLQEGTSEIAAILDTHLEMLKDPLMTTEMELKIRDNQKNTESVFQKVIADYQLRFVSIQDVFFQERVRDITDVSKRVLGHLSPAKKFDLTQIPKNAILYAQELIPSVVAEINSEHVIGIVTEVGGISSHAAIIARAKGIPYVAGISIDVLKGRPFEGMIVDGNQGIVILSPSAETLKKYQRLSSKAKSFYKELEKSASLHAHTTDNHLIELYGNLESMDEIQLLQKYGASGIGLFRSEYLFFANKGFPSEEQQYHAYREILEKLPSQPVVIRVFDVGGDKRGESGPLDGKNSFQENNPVLGCRAIRFLLKNCDIFEKQIRALLRASPYGDIHILLPMITDVSEILKTRELIRCVKEDLRKEKIPFKENIPIGCMIEVPSSAIMCDAIADHSDFLSIGTNDLVQYVVATDRSNSIISHLYSAAHPSIIRLLRQVILASGARKKSLILCGEIAADPQFIPLLLGLGIRKLSVAARHLPEVKHAVRSINLEEAKALAEKAFHYHNLEDLRNYLQLCSVID
jgi:phosphoenolpyruvate-protein phosphotransferase (PTS system enzyme I)